MDYSILCQLYEELENNPSRLKKTEILSEFFSGLKHLKNLDVIYLLNGKVFPDYSEKEFGVSDKICIKALSKASGVSDKDIVNKWRKIGDLGKVAEEIIGNKKQHTLFSNKLTVEKVIDNLRKLPELTGSGTVEKKLGIISELLTSASGIEAKYIIRTLLNDLRIGTGSGTLRDSIVLSCFDKKNEEEIKNAKLAVQEYYDISSDIVEVFEKSCKGMKYLNEVELVPGKPLKVMLALKAENIEDGFNRVGRPAIFEYKYDGFRMLITKDFNGKIRIFTRRLDDVTTQFPDVVKYILENINAKSFIIDSEAVGYDPKTKKYLPFQAISQRIKRKHNIEKLVKDLPVEINAFDLLYLNGASLISEPLKKRSQELSKIIKNHKHHLQAARQLVTANDKEAQDFYDQALSEGHEGVMIKNIESIYKPGARVGYMLKLKPAENEFDLVITGAEYGTGKRAGTLSSFLLSCYDKKNNKFVEIGKASTGLKEKEEEGLSYSELTRLVKPYIIEESGREVKIKPKIIVTVIYQNIQASPTYGSGFALRFPRIDRVRPDRGINDIATLQEIKEEYLKKEAKGY